MYDYIQGKITELTPTYLVLDAGGVGYLLNISVNTYTSLKIERIEKIFVHQVVREDAHLLYGFIDKKEREVFRLLFSVSGVGANTARMILSSLVPGEVAQAIMTENTRLLQNIKGIGTKTAQRMIVDLKDKMAKIQVAGEKITTEYNTIAEEALSALVMLGFQRSQVDKALSSIVRESKGLSVEELIKRALKVL
jgi:Holliday junction DNA helicase RuvA